MLSPAERCAQLIQQAKNITVLSGAGISTNAGIPDFRGPQGLYVTKKYDAEKVFDISYFARDPKPFYDFARDFIGLEDRIEPTFSHCFLAELEMSGKLKGIVTQNIDSLHQRAGSKNVLEMHGSFEISHCRDCEKEFLFSELREKIIKDAIPRCSCGGVIKPDIVFFGEDVKCFTQAASLARQSDLFFVLGTSCVVYPAALVPRHALGKIVIINKESVSLPEGEIVLTVHDDMDTFFTEVQKKM